MTPEQQAAFIMAKAAVLNGTITGMISANYEVSLRGESHIYNEGHFQEVVDNSGCTHNQVMQLYQDHAGPGGY